MPQLRQNYITGEWVVIAPERAKRPGDFQVPPDTSAPEPMPCRFCVDGSEYGKRVPGAETELVYVLPNAFPAFVEDPAQCSPRSFGVEHEFYTARPSVGGHDILVVKDHRLSLPTFPAAVWTDLFRTTQRRINYFYGECNVESVMPIYNHRRAAGASVGHPHAQLFAANVVPNMLTRELHHTERHYEQRGTCPFCDMIDHERTMGIRVIYEQDGFIAFTCYAARFPYEIWILPTRHGSNFEQADDRETAAFGAAVQQVCARLAHALGDPPLNYFLHTAPRTTGGAPHFHWHLEIAPRLATYGGFELGSGMVIDVTSPETAAHDLRAGA